MKKQEILSYIRLFLAPVLVMLLGAGPAMAATASVDGALFMGLAVLLVMLLSNLLAALLGKLIPCSAKLPAYAIIGAGVASLVQMLMQAFLPGAAQMLGVYLAADLFFSVRSALAQPAGKLMTLLALPVLFPAVHVVYGAGTLLGLIAPSTEEKSHA